MSIESRKQWTKAKRGNGTAVLPFIEYATHISKLEQAKSLTDSGATSPSKVED